MNLTTRASSAALAAVVLAALPAAAAPTVTRLNPPSALFAFDDPSPPFISRFLVGQRFDLQATVQADPGTTISAAAFKVHGWTVPGAVTITPIGGDRFSITRRAFEAGLPGVHRFTVEAT